MISTILIIVTITHAIRLGSTQEADSEVLSRKGHQTNPTKIQSELGSSGAIFEDGGNNGKEFSRCERCGQSRIEETQKDLFSEHPQSEETETTWQNWYAIPFPFRDNNFEVQHAGTNIFIWTTEFLDSSKRTEIENY